MYTLEHETISVQWSN